MSGKENSESREATWYCPNGHNIFDSKRYRDDNPPECASCGMIMTTSRSSYDEAHQSIEDAGIRNFTVAGSGSHKST